MDAPFTTDRTRGADPARAALRIALLYLLLSGVWIVVTDLAVSRMVSDPTATRIYQTWKGLVFVVLSAALIFALVRREIRRAEEGSDRLRVLIEQSLAGIYLIRDGRFLYVNPALARVFGYAADEMTRTVRVGDVVAERDREMVLENLRRRERGEAEDMRYRFTGRTRDGEDVRVEVHGRRVQWEGEAAVLGLLLEIGQQERLERQVREAQRLKSLGELTGQIAHDFNNFLTGIVGPLELCLVDLPPDEKARTDIEQARATALRAAALSRKLLAFSRKRPSLARAVDVNEVLASMEPLLGSLTGPGVDVRLEPCEGTCVARIDPSDLEQVVMNLVLNAGEAVGDEGSVTVRTERVRVGPGPTDRDAPHAWVRLEVEDDGPGIPEPVRERLFEPFFTTKEDGTGLGLSTVFGVVSQADGTVEVESAPGQGARFVVRVPASDQVPEPVRRPDDGVAPLEGAETILVVEDEALVREVTRRALERYGYTVHVAADGRTAREMATRLEHIDLLLTDIQLPDTRGPEVAEVVTGHHPGTPVVYFSGFSDAEVMARISEDPSAHLVHKPYVVADLLTAIRAAMEGAAGGNATS